MAWQLQRVMSMHLVWYFLS